MKLTAVLALTMVICVPQIAWAADASVFDPWLGQESAKCIEVAPLKAVAKVVELSPSQFEFVRGLYVAIPPVSHKLPVGDHAILAVAGDSQMVALVDSDGQSCSRMQIANFILDEIMAVGRGDVVHVGDPS